MKEGIRGLTGDECSMTNEKWNQGDLNQTAFATS